MGRFSTLLSYPVRFLAFFTLLLHSLNGRNSKNLSAYISLRTLKLRYFLPQYDQVIWFSQGEKLETKKAVDKS